MRVHSARKKLTLLSFSHQEETLKAAGYVSWSVKSLVTLEQGGGINLSSLEAQLETLLESVVTFNPPGDLSSALATASTSFFFLNPLIVLGSTFSPFSLCRVGVRAETHGVLWSFQRRPDFAQWRGGLDRRGAGCSRHYLAGQEGEGLSDSAFAHSLLPVSRISATHDPHHGGLHHSVLQQWLEPLF